MPADNTEWMRWNNYGIGLLDAQQYAESERAFEHVVAVASGLCRRLYQRRHRRLSMGALRCCARQPGKALQLAPHNARALYYLALVERTQGHLDAAIGDLREVIAQFPRSRDAHRELGFSFYQQHKYDEARTEYETVQSIDPDDLAAHYILSIVYRRLGMKEQATREAAAFADQKDDPTASTYALEYLRKHPEITSESVPWHVHRDHAAQDETPVKEAANEVWLAVLCLVLAVGPKAFASSHTQREHGAAVFAANGCGHCHSIHKWADTRGRISPAWAGPCLR